MANSQYQNLCSVFIGNIPFKTTEQELKKLCEEIGPVVSLRLVVDKETGKRKGYGFCMYRDEETALSACRNLHGEKINGRTLKVHLADNGKSSERNREKGIEGFARMVNNVVDRKSLLERNDSLTQYLARIPRDQLIQIVNEMNELAARNKEQAKELLLACPDLSNAIFKAKTMLGMVPPEILLQMLNTTTQASAAVHQSLRQPQIQLQPPVQSVSPQSQVDFLIRSDISVENSSYSAKLVKFNIQDHGFQHGSSMLSGLQNHGNNDLRGQVTNSRINESLDATNHRSKLLKLNDGKAISFIQE